MAGATSPRRLHASAAAAVVLLAVPLFFVGLGGYDLDLKGEPREGLTAQAALRGDFFLPLLNGERLPEKPPLFPWLVAGAMQAFGRTSEWALRLPSAVLATALLLVVLEIGRRLVSLRVGVLAAAVCGSTLLFVRLGRDARTDMTLSFFVAAALLLVLAEERRVADDPQARPPAGRVALLWIVCAAACLTKGPVGIVLPGMTALAFLLLRRRFRLVGALAAPWAALLFVLLVGSWYAYGYVERGGDFLFRSFWMENGAMFLGAAGGGGHRHPPFYFVPNYLLSGMPWSPLAAAAIVWTIRRGRGRFRDEPLLFPLLWFGLMFVFFSAGAGKRGDYMLPLLPAASLLAAAALDAADAGDAAARRALFVGAAALAAAGLLAAGLLATAAWRGVAALPGPFAEYAVKGDAAALFEEMRARPWTSGFALAALATAAAAPLVGLAAKRAAAGAFVCAGCVAALVATAVLAFVPALAARDSYKPFATKAAQAVGSGELRRYADFETQVLFYLDRDLPPLKRAEDKHDPPLDPSEDLDLFLAAPGEAFVLTDRARFERLSPERRARLAVVAVDDREAVAPADASMLLRRRPREAPASPR